MSRTINFILTDPNKNNAPVVVVEHNGKVLLKYLDDTLFTGNPNNLNLVPIGTVASVTGDNVDNTDPVNPVINGGDNGIIGGLPVGDVNIDADSNFLEIENLNYIQFNTGSTPFSPNIFMNSSGFVFNGMPVQFGDSVQVNKFLTFLSTSSVSVDNLSLFLDSADDKLKYKDNSGTVHDLLTGGSGMESEEKVFSSVLLFDKKYITTGDERYTQVGQIDFTVDFTDAVLNGENEIEIVSNGDDITFSEDFGSILSNVPLVANRISPNNGSIYRIITYYGGGKVKVAVSEVFDVPVVEVLNAPALSNPDNSVEGEITVDVTDNNSSPNEVETEMQYKETSSGTWLVHGTLAQDGTSYTYKVLSGTTDYDFRAVAKGDNVTLIDSTESNVVQATTIASTGIILMSDNFNDNNIDTNKWNIVSGANDIITETGGQLEISTTGVAGGFIGLISLDSYSSANDLIIAQAKFTRINSPNCSLQFGLSPVGFNNNTKAVFLEPNASDYDKIRTLIKDSGTNEVDQVHVGVTQDTDVRVKYVPSTGDVTFEYWDGAAWTSLAGSSGNVDLGASVEVIIVTNKDGSVDPAIIDDFFISDNDYITQYPV